MAWDYLVNALSYRVPLVERLVSAEKVISSLRARKTPSEIERIKAAIKVTEQVYEETFDMMRVGMSERQIADFMHGRLAEMGLRPSWEPEHCPAVNSGPDWPFGSIIAATGNTYYTYCNNGSDKKHEL